MNRPARPPELATCRRAVDLADQMRHGDPGRALVLAEDALALAVAPRDRAPREAWLDLQHEAWAVFGSALRATSQLRRAEEAFNVAATWLRAAEPLSPGRELELRRASLVQRMSYLRRDQERFEEALELIETAHAAFSAHGEANRAIGALADRGAILGRAGLRLEAVQHQLVAIEQWLGGETATEPSELRHLVAAVHNLALNLSELAATADEARRALAWLRLAQRLQEGLDEPLNETKMLGLEGALEAEVGDRARGVDLLRKTAERFGELAAPFEQAHVLLRLASIHLVDDRYDQVRLVAGRAFPVCRALELNREARSALILFLQAVHDDRLTLDLIDDVERRLRRARISD